MIITLYKKCLLNDSYSEVFDCVNVYKDQKTAFEYYLSTLVQKDFDCGNVYVTNSGMLQFNLNDESTNIYDYNYIKIIDDNLPLNLRTRYAFIDDIVIINALAQVYYTEDIWANYSNRMDLRMGILTRSKLLKYPLKNDTNFNIPIYDLPLTYTSNDKIKYINCFNSLPLEQKQYYIMLKIQRFKIGAVDEVTYRSQQIMLYYDFEFNTKTLTFSLDEALLRLNTLIIKSAKEKIIQNSVDVPQEYGYEIVNSYIIPTEMFENIKNSVGDNAGSSSSFNIRLNKNDAKTKYNLTNLLLINNKIITLNSTVLHGNIENFKKFAVGTLKTPIDIIQNGSDIKIELVCLSTLISFDMYLNIQNKLINITNDFEVNYPIQSNTLDATQLAHISKEIKNISLNNQRKIAENEHIKTGMELFESASSILTGVATKNPSAVISGTYSTINSGLNLSSGIIRLEEIENQRNMVNAKAYTSSRSIANMSTELLSTASGISWFFIEPDNEQEVNNYINENGYKINEIINFDLMKQFKVQTTKENIMQFDFVRMNGDFSQNIRRKLESILLNGFKIYYGI